MARSEASTDRTLPAPARAQFSPNEPVCVKQSSTVLYVDQIPDAILNDRHIRVELRSDKPFCARKPLQLTYLGVASFVDASDPDTVFGHCIREHVQDHHFVRLRPEREGLHDKHIPELIHRETRQKIRLPEQNPA